MPLLHGIDAPPGDGMVVEVHLDIIEAPAKFLEKMRLIGFDDDPFLDFFPDEYTLHYTGRARAPKQGIHKLMHSVSELVTQILEEARAEGVRMYIETELVRDIHHYVGGKAESMAALDGLAFIPNHSGAVSKADVHLEFRSGGVPAEVRSLLLQRNFYWVRTPASDRFPSEEIATLQPSVYFDARRLYERLLAYPLPGSTGVHLEQKCSIRRTHPEIHLPPVMDVVAVQ